MYLYAVHQSFRHPWEAEICVQATSKHIARKKLDLSVEGALDISIINEVQLKSLRVLEMFYI